VAVHNLQGIAILLAGLMLLYLLDGALEKLAPGLGADRGADGAHRRGSEVRVEARDGLSRPMVAAGAVLGVLSVASLTLPRFDTAPPDGLQLSARLAAGIGDLFSQEIATDRLFLGSAGFRDSVTRRFQRGGHPVDVFVGIGWRQGRARSPLSPKTALPGSGWILEQEKTRVLEPDGREVREILVRSDTHVLLAYHWYVGSSGLVAEALRSFSAVDASPFRRPGEIIAVRITTEVEGPVASGLGPALDRLDAFYAELQEVIQALAGEPRLARGKPFPQFPTRAMFFHATGIAPPEKILSIRELGAESSLGMALATSSDEVTAVGVAPSRGTRIGPPQEPGAGGSERRKTLASGIAEGLGQG